MPKSPFFFKREKWKDGKEHFVVRDKKGRLTRIKEEVWKDGKHRIVARVKGRLVKRIEVEPLPKKEVRWYRVTLAYNKILVHEKYYSVKLWFFDRKPWTREEAKAKFLDSLYDTVEKFVGYPESEWWFRGVLGFECEQVPANWVNLLPGHYRTSVE